MLKMKALRTLFQGLFLFMVGALMVGCSEDSTGADGDSDWEENGEIDQTEQEAAEIEIADIDESEVEEIDTEEDQLCAGSRCFNNAYHYCDSNYGWIMTEQCYDPYICVEEKYGCSLPEVCTDEEPACDYNYDFWRQIVCIDGKWQKVDECEPDSPCVNGKCKKDAEHANHDLFIPCTNGCEMFSRFDCHNEYEYFCKGSCENMVDGDLDEEEHDVEIIWCGSDAPYCIDGVCLVCPPGRTEGDSHHEEICNDRGTHYTYKEYPPDN